MARVNRWRAQRAAAGKKVRLKNPVKPTMLRTYNFPDHRPPSSGVFDADERVWHGSSRVADPAARRRANKRSWKKIKDEARRAFVATKKGV